MRIDPHTKRTARAAAAVISVAATLVWISAPAGAGPYEDDDNASAWVPRHFYTIMTNDSQYRDVSYYFRFTDGVDGAGAMADPMFDGYPNTEVATIEIGYKETGHPDCRDPDNFVTVGIPSASNPQVDISEDSTDAVLWMSSLNDLREDQLDDPTKDYYAAWKCDEDAEFRSDPVDEIGPFQVQLGHSTYAPPSPIFTLSERTFNLVPREQAFHGVPSETDARDIHLAFDAPWALNWNFESGTTSEWHASSADLDPLCGYGAPLGDCYMFVDPMGTHPEDSEMYQYFWVRGGSGETGDLELGDNTNYTFESYFRCPTWAPGQAGSSDDFCPVRVGIKSSQDGPWDTEHYEDFQVEADGEWHLVESQAWGAQTSSAYIETRLLTDGHALDVDGFWISSGL